MLDNNVLNSVIIKLGCTGTISGFDIDTTGFMDAAPTNVLVEGYVENKNHGEKVTKKKDMHIPVKFKVLTTRISGSLYFLMYLLI